MREKKGKKKPTYCLCNGENTGEAIVIACSSEEREKFRRENENVYWTMIYHLIPLFA
jgi:hypothetical protein